MNMKKSIAGVMAGAMAVSAMAAVVSADQDAISLTYDLKTYVNNVNKTAAKVTVVANYEASFINAESWKADDVYEDRDGDGVKETQVAGFNSGWITFGADNGFVRAGDIFNDKGVKIGEVPYDGNKEGAAAMKEFEFTARPFKDIVNDVEEKYQTFKATNYADNSDGAYYDKNLGKATYKMPITVGNNAYGSFNLTKFDLYSLGYSVEENANAAGIAKVTEPSYAVRDAVAKMTYEVPNTVSLNKANGWGWGGANWPHLTEEELEDAFQHFFGVSFYGDVTMSAENFAKGFWNSWGGKKGVYIDPNGTSLASQPTTVAVGAFTAGATEETIVPFKTTLNPGSKKWEVTDATGKKSYIETKENDVVYALQNRKAGGNFYTKPVAVLNDAIANHTNVTFTFTSYDGYVATAKSHAMNQWVEIDQGFSYETSSFDWHNPTFGQHLYRDPSTMNGYSYFDTDDYDMYGSFSSAWGVNLFTGAVVVNNGLSMQLSDTDTFNWGSNTLTFDWFDITDDGKVTDAKTFLTSMLLYTPVDWYWDKLTVVVTDEEREDIDAGEGLTDDAEVIEDETEPEIIEEPETEPEVVEEPEVTEAAPVETAPSPATGNAPVALAVIPVALAAAAVVAKKRG